MAADITQALARATAGRSLTPEQRSTLVRLAERFAANPKVIASLDPEQQLAALTSQRGVVAAGAGSGKTFTLQVRLRLLLAEKVPPSRIVAMTFNRAAAAEIKHRLADLGPSVEELRIGTMHSLFARWVTQFGTEAEKKAITTRLITDDGDLGSQAPSPRRLAGLMARLWVLCREDRPPRGVSTIVQRWAVQELSPSEAAAAALTKTEQAAAVWYEWGLGFRGMLGPLWKPPCTTDEGKQRWASFMARYRRDPAWILGELNDMILLLHRILQRDKGVIQQIAQGIDHLLIDEGQDLNRVQHNIVAALAPFVKSVWIVGDERQSINAFVGASPELFAGLLDRDYSLRSILTNYRSLPEIVETANELMKHHPTRLNLASRPDPQKPRGKAEIQLVQGLTHEELALRLAGKVREWLTQGNRQPHEIAILTRTNAEVDSLEAGCLVAAIPYTRRGGRDFLRTPEMLAVRGYLSLLVDGDLDGLVECLEKPSRFFLNAGQAVEVVLEIKAALRQKYKREPTIRELLALDSNGERLLEEALKGLDNWQSWQTPPAREEIQRLFRLLAALRPVALEQKQIKSKELLDLILAIDGAPPREGKPRPVLRDVLLPFGGDDAEDTTVLDGEVAEPIGSLAFLYSLVESQKALADPPELTRYLRELDEGNNRLSYDARAWADKQSRLPVEQREPVPAVTLSTVHSVKGLQWPIVVVMMGPGVFPFRGRKEAAINDAAAEKLAQRAAADLLTERQLAYVALTRPTSVLWIAAPARNVFGKAEAPSQFIREAGLEGKGKDAGELLRPLPEVVQTTPMPQVRKAKAARLSEGANVLEAYGLTIVESETTPKDEKKKPRPVWLVRGNTVQYKDLLASAGGRFFDPNWSFFSDPTEALTAALKARAASSEAEAGDAAEDEPTALEASDDAAPAADAAKAEQRPATRAAGLAVRATMTTPTRPGKQPRPVWNVVGETRRYAQLLRSLPSSLGGSSRGSRWSFWQDPTDELEKALSTAARPTFADVKAHEAERSAERAERLLARAGTAARESNAAFAQSQYIADKMDGSPIKVGHHSEGRHRRDIAKMDSAMGRSVAASEKAERLTDRAASAARNAEQNHSKAFLKNRIDEANAELRRLDRVLAERGYAGIDKMDWDRQREDAEDERAYYQRKLDEKGGISFSRSDFKDGDEVLYGGTYYPVDRANATTVTLSNWLGRRGLTWRLPYAKVQQIRRKDGTTLDEGDRAPAEIGEEHDQQADAERLQAKEKEGRQWVFNGANRGVAWLQEQLSTATEKQNDPREDEAAYWQGVMAEAREELERLRSREPKAASTTPSEEEESADTADDSDVPTVVELDSSGLAAYAAVKALGEVERTIGKLRRWKTRSRTQSGSQFRGYEREEELQRAVQNKARLIDRLVELVKPGDAVSWGGLSEPDSKGTRRIEEGKLDEVEDVGRQGFVLTRTVGRKPWLYLTHHSPKGGAAESPRQDAEDVELADSVCDPSSGVCDIGILGGSCGVDTVLLVRDGTGSSTIPARYCLTDVERLIPSHVSPAHSRRSGLPAYSARPDYPRDVQERRYQTPTELAKVQRIADSMEPAEILATGASPVTGPPVVTANGWVLGGNGRDMGVDTYYSEHPNDQRFKDYLAKPQVCGGFGFKPAQVRELRRPIIVRVVDTIAGRRDARPDSLTSEERAELVKLVRVLNFSLTQALDAASQSVSAARSISTKALEALARGIGDSSLAEYLDSSASAAFVRELKAESVISATDPQLYSGPDRLSASGRELVERVLASLLLPDADRLERAGAELRRSLAQIAPYLLAAQGTAAGFDLAKILPVVVADFMAYRATGGPLDSYLKQSALFSSERIERVDPRHLPLLRWLDANAGAYRRMSSAARAYLTAAAEFVSPQIGMFATTKETEAEAFARIFK